LVYIQCSNEQGICFVNKYSLSLTNSRSVGYTERR